MSWKPCSSEQSANYACFSDKQGYQQSYDAALVGADRSKDIVVLRLLNLQVRPVSDAAAPLTNHALACYLSAGR